MLAAERRDVTMSLLHQQAVRSGARPIVPAVVLNATIVTSDPAEGAEPGL